MFEDGEEKAREAIHVHLTGAAGGGAEGIIVSKFHVCQVDVPVVRSLIDDHW